VIQTDALPKQRKCLSARHRKLLASVAGLGVVALLAGPGGYYPSSLPMLSSSAQAGEALQQQPVSFADLVARVKPAVVSVRVKIDAVSDSELLPGSRLEKFFQQFGFESMPDGVPSRHETITGEGSGFFISADGYAVTNNHVVDNAKTVQVTTDNGTVYAAKVVGTDAKTDLALIKVDAKGPFAYVKFANDDPRVGDWVVAVGNPFGLGGTVTAGIVSARGRDIGSGPYDDYIQIDAPINKGNSGGPAFDMNGNVIGVNTAIVTPSGGSVGIGFDIPADTAKMVVAQLEDKGYVTRGWMGVEVQPVTSAIADSLGMKKVEGALVDAAQAGSPASKAGIEVGDVIEAINGTPVKNSRDLARKVAIMAPGTSAKFDIVHGGEAKTVTLAVGQMPNEKQAAADHKSTEQTAGVPHLGLALAPAAAVSGAGQKGVAVVGIDPNGLAADHGFEIGDVILDVSGKAVANVSQVREALTEAQAHGKHDVLMRVKTADGTRFIAVPLHSA
jgi:serine protease Do